MENQVENEQEVSLLDLLLVVGENIRLLVLGVLFAGVLGYAGALVWTPTFVSEAILLIVPQTSTSKKVSDAPNGATAANQAASMMLSPLVLDPLVVVDEELKVLPIEVGRVLLLSKVKAVVGKDGLLRLTTSAKDAVAAQKLANDVIQSWLATSVPRDLEREELEKRLDYVQKGFASTSEVINSLKASDLLRPSLKGDAGTTLLSVGELQARYIDDELSLRRQLQGFTWDVVKQPPTLPRQAISPKKALVSVVAAAATFIFLLLFVFARNSWRSAQTDPQTAKKLKRISAAFGFN